MLLKASWTSEKLDHVRDVSSSSKQANGDNGREETKEREEFLQILKGLLTRLTRQMKNRKAAEVVLLEPLCNQGKDAVGFAVVIVWERGLIF